MSPRKIIVAATITVMTLISAATTQAVHKAAQAGIDMGMGLSLPEMRGRGGGSGSPPLTANWTWNTHGTVLWNTNGKVRCNGC